MTTHAEPAAPTPAERRELEALRAGDEGVFMEVVRRYSPSMLRVAQIYVSSRAVAEEVVQEAWLGVLKALDRFEGRSSLKTWIFRILTNTAKTRAIREGRTLPFSALERPGLVQEAAVDADRFLEDGHPRWPGHWASPPRRLGDLPEERLLAGEALAVIDKAVAELPANQRAVITMRDVQGWSAEEVCNALDISETNQRVLLHRARAKVRRSLEAYLEEDVA